MIKRLVIIAIAAFNSILLVTATTYTQETKPLWAYVPSTISPEWGDYLLEKGQGRHRPVPAPDDIVGWRELQVATVEASEARADKTAEVFNVTYEETAIGGVPVVEVTPKNLVNEKKIAVYTHGGAYVVASAKSLLNVMALFANTTGLKVIGIDYTLAPHSKWQQTTDEVISVFKALQDQGYKMDDIVIYGDSAGGGLAAGSTLKMRDLGMGMPAALVLWSPWTDISETNAAKLSFLDRLKPVLFRSDRHNFDP